MSKVELRIAKLINEYQSKHAGLGPQVILVGKRVARKMLKSNKSTKVKGPRDCLFMGVSITFTPWLKKNEILLMKSSKGRLKSV